VLFTGAFIPNRRRLTIGDKASDKLARTDGSKMEAEEREGPENAITPDSYGILTRSVECANPKHACKSRLFSFSMTLQRGRVNPKNYPTYIQ
jgi:hypothetical protein